MPENRYEVLMEAIKAVEPYDVESALEQIDTGLGPRFLEAAEKTGNDIIIDLISDHIDDFGSDEEN